MMKKTVSMMLALTMAGTMGVSALAANDEPMVIAPAPSVAQQAAMQVVVKGKAIPMDAYAKDGTVMVPLRAISEALGFKVTWNNDKRAVNINDGTMQSDLTIGENRYQVYTAVDDMVGMSGPFSLGSAPVLVGNKTYVPVELFVPLFGNDPATVVVENNTVTIDPDAVSGDDAAQIPNPLSEHTSLAELNKALGFEITLPSVPEGYKAETYIDIAGETGDIRFMKGEDELCYRVAKGSDDISGDYNVYAETRTVKNDAGTITLRGADGKVFSAIWTRGGFTYSVVSDEGLTDAQVLTIAQTAAK